jgi:transcriptional regulator EpsA
MDVESFVRSIKPERGLVSGDSVASRGNIRVKDRRPSIAEGADELVRHDVIEIGGPPATPGSFLTAGEGEKFLRLVSQTLRVRRHYELFQLLQREVQYFIPHQILISAWGDFLGPNLTLDVVSALPGVRTNRIEGCDIDGVLKSLYLRWLTHGRQPVLLDRIAIQGLMQRGCDCALHRSFKDMRSAVVHGNHDARSGTDSLYLVANSADVMRQGESERFPFLVDSVIAQIEIGFRRVAGLRTPGSLSAREEEILAWVAEGKTNSEISRILAISSFTVKNHVQRIIRKLGASNRTEAVTKYRQGRGSWRRESAEGAEVLLAK